MSTTSVPPSCARCRHSSKITREKVLNVEHEDNVFLDEDRIAVDETQTEEVFFCQKRGGREIGIGEVAGSACADFEAGSKQPLPPHILRLLARFDA